jgi:hypothetical protein
MRNFVTSFMLLAVLTLAGCSGSNDEPDAPTQPSAVAITESFSGSLNVNGARTHDFGVDRSGQVTAQLKTLSDQAATIGVSLGTFNGSACAILISKTDAVLNSTVTGIAQSTGRFCVWLNDVGKLTAGVDYTIEVTHF